jgi:hypothetical protein
MTHILPTGGGNASAIGIKHQARVHHGAFLAGRQLTRTRGSERLRRTARLKVWCGPIATSVPC